MAKYYIEVNDLPDDAYDTGSGYEVDGELYDYNGDHLYSLTDDD